MRRREFLKQSLAISFSLPLLANSKSFANNSSGLLSSGSLTELVLIGSSRRGRRMPGHDLRIFNSKFEFLGLFPTPRSVLPHICIQDSKCADLVYGVTRHGNHAWVFNLRTGLIERELALPARHQFWGHGVIVENGDLLLSAKNYQAACAVLLRYRDARLIESIPIPSLATHEIAASPEDPTVLVMTHHFVHTGSIIDRRNSARVTWFDFKTRKVLRQVASRLSLGPGHLRFLESTSQRLLVLGNHVHPAVEIIEGNESTLIEHVAVRSLWPEGTETLNAAIDPRDPDTAWATCPEFGLLLEIDLRKKIFRNVTAVEGVLDVFARNGELLVSARAGAMSHSHILVMNGRTLNRRATLFGDGSHFTTLKA